MGQNDVRRERDQLLRVFAGIGGIAPAPATGSRGCTATAKPNVDGSTPVISVKVWLSSEEVRGLEAGSAGAATPSITLAPSPGAPALAAGMAWIASMAASSCSSDVALTPPLCSNFISRGTKSAQIFM